MRPAQVLVAEGVWGPPFEHLATAHQVRRLERTAETEDLAGASALVVRNRTAVTRELLSAAPDLQVVGRAGAGLDNIDVQAADELGVVVVAAPGANAVSVAEHAVGLALAVARRTLELDGQTKAGAWDRSPGRELAGGVWGLLSAGATARATGRLARGLGMSVCAFDPYCDPTDPELAEIGIELTTLEQVVAAADVLSVHLPATRETVGLVEAQLLGLARPGLILINVGRGDVLDEAAVVDALRTGQLGGAGLDVRTTEPPCPGVLETLPNVVLTPHVAGITGASQLRIAQALVDGITAVLSGNEAPRAVTRGLRPARVALR